VTSRHTVESARPNQCVCHIWPLQWTRLFCEERENLKRGVARAARRYIEAADLRKDAQDSADAEAARRQEHEARREYQEARAALEKHGREHGCLH
jgi:hypothetical protein